MPIERTILPHRVLPRRFVVRLVVPTIELHQKEKPWTGIHGIHDAQVERESVNTEGSSRMSFDFPSNLSFR